MRATLSLTFVALGVSFSNTPHTGCNDAAPAVVEALAAEQGYAPHMVKSCGDIAAAEGGAAAAASAGAGAPLAAALALKLPSGDARGAATSTSPPHTQTLRRVTPLTHRPRNLLNCSRMPNTSTMCGPSRRKCVTLPL